MTTQRLSQLMQDATEELATPELAATAWRQAGRVRRRRVGMALAAATTAAAVSIGLVVAPHKPAPQPGPEPSVTQQTTSPVQGLVLELPLQLDYRAGLPIPRRLDVNPLTAQRLSRTTLTKATALYQPNFDPDAEVPGPIYAYGDGQWVELDGLNLVHTHDSGGNRFTPMRTTSLSPDGLRAAFPQPDAVVLVDLTTGMHQTLALPGLNEHVLWAPDSRSLVVGEDRLLYRVQLNGSYERIDGSPWDVVAGASSLGQVELAGGGRPDGGALRPVTVSVNGSARNVDQRPLGTSGMDEWYGRGWFAPDGRQVARSGWVHTSSVSGVEGVAVLSITDDGWGVLRRLLVFGMDEPKGCCETLGWSDDHTVLVLARRQGLLRWDVTAGAVTRATETINGLLSLPDLSRG